MYHGYTQFNITLVCFQLERLQQAYSYSSGFSTTLQGPLLVGCACFGGCLCHVYIFKYMCASLYGNKKRMQATGFSGFILIFTNSLAVN